MQIMNDKQIRQKIMAIAAAKYNWDYDEFHDLMEDWGFGRSLRALPYDKLLTLKKKLQGIQTYNENFELDKQGRYMYRQLRLAGWNMRRLTLYMIKHFQKTHWNLLHEQERRAVLNMLRSYNRKNNE